MFRMINGINYPNINSDYRVNNYGSGSITAVSNSVSSKPQVSLVNSIYSNNSLRNKISFAASKIRTSLSSKDEKKMYKDVAAMLDADTKQKLHVLLKNGKLLDASANDKSTTLDNLYKIATEPRVAGVDKEVVLKDVISTINYPFAITQKFGDIPSQKVNEMISKESEQGKSITAMDLNVNSSTCPAASIEFNLAHKMPAEFARMAQSLSSEKMCVEKSINVGELSQGLTNTIWMLNEFGTEHKLLDWNTLNVTLRPDKNAVLRAQIQNSYKDAGERSVVDVLMQSTFMNVAAQNSYDSLLDKRIPKYNDDDSGLIDIEKNFIEELATGKGKVCVTYQRLDDSGKLAGYECEPEETFAHIKDTLDNGDNVIIGYTYCDEDKNIIGGHEITIIGIEKDRNGNRYFVCNDTDDGVNESVTYLVDDLLPKIHHAGIPKNVLGSNVEFVEPWKELMQIYKDTRTQLEVSNVVRNPQRLSVLNNAA